MALKFRYNDTTYSLATSDKGSVNFCYQQNGTTYKVPASSTRGTSVQFAEDDNYYYKMDNSSPTLCFRKNNTTYYCAKSITSEAKITYDIPAGTYTPSAFETLIKNYISSNTLRKVSNAFTVTVNNQTVSVSSGSYIYYTESSSSPNGYVRSVAFGSTNGYAIDGNNEVKAPNISCCNSANGFTSYKTYVTYIFTGSAFNYVSTIFKSYANYNITVTTGINFS
jgi:hypothetical protein